MEPPENHDREPDHEQRIPEMRVIAELHIPAAETERRRTNDEQTNNHEKWKLRVEIATLVVAAITMGAVICYACVAHKQWGEMIATNTTSGESAKAAKSAADTVATSLEFSRQQQRAWVIPRIEREFSLRMGRGPENLVSFDVFNYGQSLAVEVVTRAELNTGSTLESVTGPVRMRGAGSCIRVTSDPGRRERSRRSNAPSVARLRPRSGTRMTSVATGAAPPLRRSTREPRAIVGRTGGPARAKALSPG